MLAVIQLKQFFGMSELNNRLGVEMEHYCLHSGRFKIYTKTNYGGIYRTT